MEDKDLTVERKALSVNLDSSKYGTFAEIGAGQETANYFFRVSASASAARSRPDVTVRETRELEGVLALRGASDVALGAVLAHEYAHGLFFLDEYPPMRLETEEGLCELFAWLWLSAGRNGEDEAENARRRRAMEERKDPVYGDGFRAALSAFREASAGTLGNLLARVRETGELPSA